MDARRGAVLPDWRGVRLRRPGEEDVRLIPWGTSVGTAAAISGVTPDAAAQGRWLPVHGVAPFSDPTATVAVVSLAFRDDALVAATFTMADHHWDPAPWITAELTAAYGPPSGRRVAEVGVAEDYEQIHWSVPGLRITHGLVSVYAGPSEGAEERIEFTAT